MAPSCCIWQGQGRSSSSNPAAGAGTPETSGDTVRPAAHRVLAAGVLGQSLVVKQQAAALVLTRLGISGFLFLQEGGSLAPDTVCEAENHLHAPCMHVIWSSSRQQLLC